MKLKALLFLLLLLGVAPTVEAQHSVAREWNEVLLQAIRGDFARPTVHARNLFHVSAAMYDAWSVYDEEARTYLLGQVVDDFPCVFAGMPEPANLEEARHEAISYAAYRIITHRFSAAPQAPLIMNSASNLLISLGYDPAFDSMDYSGGNPAALGNYIANCYISFGLQDGANEQLSYENQFYEPVNPSLIIELPGNPNIVDYNRWQPITLEVFIDQSGNPFPLNTPEFLSPEWGQVSPFSLEVADVSIYERDGFEYQVFHDPGPPPYLSTDTVGGLSEEYKWGNSLVAIWSGHLDTAIQYDIDISPASIGNITDYPTTIEGQRDFYNYLEGGDNSPGHDLNPTTGQPYPEQLVSRADYGRILAEFWADGPDSETPPGHWFTILNYVNDHPDLEKRFRGDGPLLDDLEWDIKSYFTLGGAMHDVAITVWGIKGWYDYIRPVSAIRGMAELGQSSDPALPSYHPGGIHLVPGYIELVEAGDPLALLSPSNIGKIKIYAWRGPDFIFNPNTDEAGVDWILAEAWWPYQRPSFVTPPFAGYVSGHSTFSRAAADVLTYFTGDNFFPGGVGEFSAAQNDFLVFEQGPSEDIVLQWATYQDASDQCSLSRIWGGIHPPADDIPGRLIGIEIGQDAFNLAEQYFYRDVDEDGVLSYLDCDDTDPTVYPNAPEICDGKDNSCNGQVDDGLETFTYYFDEDQDGFGTEATSVSICATEAPDNYVTNNLDCNDSNPMINPNSPESCDGIDNNCSGLVDDGLTLYTYYFDEDGDGFGDPDNPLDTCAVELPVDYVRNDLDCDDTNPGVNPDTLEIEDGLDNDCNGLIDDDVVSVNNLTIQAVEIFPNPVAGELQLKQTAFREAQLEVFNLNGQRVMMESLDFRVNGGARVDVASLTPGIYLLVLSGEEPGFLLRTRMVKW
ncbi:MAG: MopE-related protein [Bacteroidota bacterium]